MKKPIYLFLTAIVSLILTTHVRAQLQIEASIIGPLIAELRQDGTNTLDAKNFAFHIQYNINSDNAIRLGIRNKNLVTRTEYVNGRITDTYKLTDGLRLMFKRNLDASNHEGRLIKYYSFFSDFIYHEYKTYYHVEKEMITHNHGLLLGLGIGAGFQYNINRWLFLGGNVGLGFAFLMDENLKPNGSFAITSNIIERLAHTNHIEGLVGIRLSRNASSKPKDSGNLLIF